MCKLQERIHNFILKKDIVLCECKIGEIGLIEHRG